MHWLFGFHCTDIFGTHVWTLGCKGLKMLGETWTQDKADMSKCLLNKSEAFLSELNAH